MSHTYDDDHHHFFMSHTDDDDDDDEHFFMSHTYVDDDIQHFFMSHKFDKIYYISLKLLTGYKGDWSFEAGQKIFQGAVIHQGGFDRTVFEKWLK